MWQCLGKCIHDFFLKYAYRMDGYECTRKIRQYEKEQKCKPVPIIGLSGNVRQEHHNTAIQAGMTIYMNKPIQANDIMRLISKL